MTKPTYLHLDSSVVNVLTLADITFAHMLCALFVHTHTLLNLLCQTLPGVPHSQVVSITAIQALVPLSVKC